MEVTKLQYLVKFNLKIIAVNALKINRHLDFFERPYAFSLNQLTSCSECL